MQVRGTHTHGKHRALHDSLGMLCYCRNDRVLMGRFVLDYLRERPLRLEAFLGRVVSG